MGRHIQRAFDVLLAMTLLLPAVLVVAMLSIGIKVTNGYSPFFVQERLGLGGKPFRCLKLQTMIPLQNAPSADFYERQTKFGSWLRDHGFDELPQLINILRGQMSFFGPRPYTADKIDYFKEMNPDLTSQLDRWWSRRLSMLPGLSGWHQTHSLGPALVAYELSYFENHSLRRQAYIFAASSLIFVIGKKRYFALFGRSHPSFP